MTLRLLACLLSAAFVLACSTEEPSTTNGGTGTGDDTTGPGGSSDVGSDGGSSSDGGSTGESVDGTGTGGSSSGEGSSEGSSSGGPPGPECGNGVVEEAEQCDDGNIEDGDGCSSRCVDEVKLVFITSEVYGSDLGGLDGADALCQQRADAAGLAGDFRAWLSDSSESPSTRFTPSSVPYVRVDGVQIASDWNDLLDGEIDAVIDVDEAGGAAPIMAGHCGKMRPTVWSNTLISGEPGNPSNTCGDWTGVGIGSAWGLADLTNEGWTDGCVGSGCKVMSALYCFEQ